MDKTGEVSNYSAIFEGNNLVDNKH